MTGRRVAKHLTAAGLPVRVASRHGDPVFDWDDASTWQHALDGVGAAYLTYPTDLGVDGAAERVRAFAAAAVAGGTRRLVLLSGRGQNSHAPAERAVQESGAEWTVVRSAWFAQNLTEGFLADMVRDGVLALPAGDAAEPFVDLDDVAAVAAAALTEDGHARTIYEVSGPHAITFTQVADFLSRAMSRPVRYVPTSMEQYADEMSALGTPGDLVDVLAEVFTELRSSDSAHPVDGVQQALGRAPRPFPDFIAHAHKDAILGDQPRPSRESIGNGLAERQSRVPYRAV